MPEKNGWNMRASLTAFILTSVLLAASYVGVVAQHHTKYGVTVTEVKRHALAKVRTYTWTVSHPSLDKTADKRSSPRDEAMPRSPMPRLSGPMSI